MNEIDEVRFALAQERKEYKTRINQLIEIDILLLDLTTEYNPVPEEWQYSKLYLPSSFNV